ncbi:hypothetical protein K1719_016114 [Acacia pycnantha]|nr:hypothetical protein K1719_016114 [Acacia pycnantha]
MVELHFLQNRAGRYKLICAQIHMHLRWVIYPKLGQRKAAHDYGCKNIGSCHFIFGPCLWVGHWICYVLDTTTMTFYALDSVHSLTYLRMQREKEEPNKLPTKKAAKKKVLSFIEESHKKMRH